MAVERGEAEAYFRRVGEEAIARLAARIERVHEDVACPTCNAPAGARCRHLSVARGWPYGRVLKHPHAERVRAAGIPLR